MGEHLRPKKDEPQACFVVSFNKASRQSSGMPLRQQMQKSNSQSNSDDYRTPLQEEKYATSVGLLYSLES